MLVVDLGRKLDLLLPGVPRSRMKTEIARNYFEGRIRTPDSWFANEPESERTEVNINNPGPSKIIEYLAEKGIVFRDDWFVMELEEFKSAIRKPEPNEGYAPGFDPVKMARALVGTYQIIRRFVDKTDKYILEPLVIDYDEKLFRSEATAYSRNEIRQDRLYSGDVLIDERCCFSLLERPHKSVSKRRIGRAMLLQPNFRSKGDTMEIDECFSGLILRGVSAKSTHQRGVGVPFVAIQLKNEPLRLSEIRCDDITDDNCVVLSDNIFIGELTDTQPEMFKFCDTFFRALEFESKNVLQAVAAGKVANKIRQAAGRQKSCRKLWEEFALTYVPPNTSD